MSDMAEPGVETTVVVGCPACGRRYRFDTRRFGTSGVRVRCRSCEMVMRVRVDPEILSAAEDRQPAAQLRQQVASVSPPVSPAPATLVPPASVVEPSPTAAHPEPDEYPAEPRVDALVADRDADRGRILGELLETRGFTVTKVQDGVDARRVIAAVRPAVVFLNAFLPRVLGVTLCAEIKRHPELAAASVVLVGSQYRRGRFVRDPMHLYGADAFVDGSGTEDEIKEQSRNVLRRLMAGTPKADAVPADELAQLERLARIIAGDIILYNPSTAETEIAAGQFFDTFAAEIREGEGLVARRFPSMTDRRSVFHATLKAAVEQHARAAGIPASVDGAPMRR